MQFRFRCGPDCLLQFGILINVTFGALRCPMQAAVWGPGFRA